MSVVVAARAGASLESVLTVDIMSPTGTLINQRLRGGLHPFGQAGPPSAAAKAQAAGLMNVNRTDKMLSVTPIKAGAPDATHPTLGISGNWSYDWRVVDRTIADIAAQGPSTELYLGLDSCPQILGGSVPPFTGDMLTGANPSGLAAYSSFASAVPSSDASFAEMCVDLIDRILSLGTVELVYCGVGNEVDGGQYWAGTSAQYFAHYAAIAAAVKAYDPTLKIGGPELVDPNNNFTVWARGLMVYCQTNAVPLDFLSFHDYADNGWMLQKVCATVDKAKSDLGWADPLDLINGEWDKGPGPLPPFGEDDTKIEIGDVAAAGVLGELMEMQRLGVSRAIYFKNTFRFEIDGDFGSGVVNDVGSWAPGNAFRLWRMLDDAAVVEHTLSADPGIAAMAALGDDGAIYVLVANMHYKRTGTFPLTIGLDGVTSGRETTLWMIDREHSNQYEAGLANAELQTVPVANVAAEQVRLTLPARCACLLEIAP